MAGVFDDSRLFEFSTYDDYLNSFITTADMRNLQNDKISRMIAMLGYRSPSETLSREQFELRKAIVMELNFPKRKAHKLYCEGLYTDDNVLLALAERERANRVGLLSTIIFVRHHFKTGVEVSGYIDLQHSFQRTRAREPECTDWELVFAGKKHLCPTIYDLGYFNWKKNYCRSNDTENYKVISNPKRGLIFMNRKDHQEIRVDPLCSHPGENTLKTNIQGPKYEQFVLFDHVLRK